MGGRVGIAKKAEDKYDTYLRIYGRKKDAISYTYWRYLDSMGKAGTTL